MGGWLVLGEERNLEVEAILEGVTPEKTNDWRGPKMMGLGKGGSVYINMAIFGINSLDFGGGYVFPKTSQISLDLHPLKPPLKSWSVIFYGLGSHGIHHSFFTTIWGIC